MSRQYRGRSSRPIQNKQLYQALQQKMQEEYLTQSEIAEAISVSEKTLQRWIYNNSIPRATERKRICDYLGLDAKELGFDALVSSTSANELEDVSKILASSSLHTRSSDKSRLLKKVHSAWIEGRYRPSLYRGASIPLCWRDRPDVRPEVWKHASYAPVFKPRSFPPETTLLAIYDENGALLLFGASGLGKTVLLLELAEALLTRAMANEEEMLPVVFTLSSWTPRYYSFASWLADELLRRYGIPLKEAQMWVREHRLILLLDGLDEVTPEKVKNCITAINEYRCEGDHFTPLVVCCRTDVYLAQSERLNVEVVLEVLPLTDDVISTHIKQVADAPNELWRVLQQHPTLLQFARTPLVFSMLLQLHEDQSVEVLVLSDIKHFWQRLFDAYVHHTLNRYGKTEQYIPEYVEQQMNWLAWHLKQQDLTLFSFERLQPRWLRHGIVRRSYAILVMGLLGMLFGGVFLAVSGILIGGRTSLLDWLNPWLIDASVGVPLLLWFWGLLGGYLVGSLIGVVYDVERLTIRTMDVITWSWHNGQWRFYLFLLVGMLSGFICWHIGPFIYRRSYQSTWAQIHNGGFVVWLLYELIDGLLGMVIYSAVFWVEQHRAQSPSSFKAFWLMSRMGLLVGVFTALFEAIVEGPLGSPIYNHIQFMLINPAFAIPAHVLTGLGSGLVGGIVCGIIGGFTRSCMEEEHLHKPKSPNVSVHRAFRTSMIIGVSCGGTTWVLFVLLSGLDAKLLLASLLSLQIALLFGLFNGGTIYLQHTLLWCFLCGTEHLPWHYSRLLAYATKCRLVYDMQGEYSFIHEQLAAYFAEHYERSLTS